MDDDEYTPSMWALVIAVVVLVVVLLGLLAVMALNDDSPLPPATTTG